MKPVGEGQWRAEGLLWHMAGRWELAFEVESLEKFGQHLPLNRQAETYARERR